MHVCGAGLPFSDWSALMIDDPGCLSNGVEGNTCLILVLVSTKTEYSNMALGIVEYNVTGNSFEIPVYASIPGR